SPIDPNQFASSANTTKLAGLQTMTKEPVPPIPMNPRGGADAPMASGVTAPRTFGTSASDTVALSNHETTKRRETSSAESSLLASAYLEKGKGYSSANGGKPDSAGGTGTGSGGSGRSETGASWFGSKSATPGEGKFAESGFSASDRELASRG